MKEHTKWRLYEMIPGGLVWLTFVLSIGLSFVKPLWVVYFIIVFDLYWLFRVMYFLIYLSVSYRRFRYDVKYKWFEKLQDKVGWEKMYHLIFLPTYKESTDVIRDTLKSLSASKYPNNKMILVLAGEERDHIAFQENAKIIKGEFAGVFHKIIVTEHPMNLPDEIPGKGSNLNYTGHQVQKVIDEMGIAYEDIIVSSFDVDTAVHPEYFACLTTKFLEQDNPYRCSYQPVTLYGNNIWQSSAPVRIGVFGTTFWLMSELARPERLWTFSSHSMSFKMLVDVGFWEKDIVSEDSRIFLQGFFHYHGDYSVVPIYVPVNMDAVAGGSYWDSLVSLYKQQRRWAWGVEHLPYLITHFSKDKLIPLKKKIKFVFNHIEGMYTWATAPILIFALGYLPLFMARDIQTVIVRNAPFTLEWIMRFAMIGVLISAIFATTLLPRRPAGVRRRNWVVMILQWLLLPITFVVFGAFPAIDAQTRLMLGKYLGFKVTKKTR